MSDANRKVDSLACALRSLEATVERGRIARLAVLRYVFEALSEGVPLEQIIEQTGFRPPPTRYSYLFGDTPDPRRAFADWAAAQFRELLREMAA